MREYFKKREAGICYIIETYGEVNRDGFKPAAKGISAGRALLRHIGDNIDKPIFGVKWEANHVVYAVTDSGKEDSLERKGFTVFYHIGITIGRGGSLWSKYTAKKMDE